MKTYSELIRMNTFEDRLNYLRLHGKIGVDTFGFDRYVNQKFYKSREWKEVRHYIITRDYGCDLGIRGMELYENILIHHMNPISISDILDSTDILLNPEYLISTCINTHNTIHYGTIISPVKNRIIDRKPGDTKLW